MTARVLPDIVKFTGEDPLFKAGDRVRISVRFPVGHYRVPQYIRGKNAIVEAVIRPRAVNNEEEGFGLNAGLKRYYYRVAIPLSNLWPGYAGSPNDNLRIEVFETWLERAE
ncbi:MAG: nitrile hydratase subunit beta [Acidobacteriaceae bacterium]|nr:nitrile hydratase subunit beta [Acidobacteriaceae bacterium]